MLTVLRYAPSPIRAQGPESRLNEAWRGRVERVMVLPRGGQLVLVLPLAGLGMTCDGVRIRPDRYLLIAPGEEGATFTLGAPAAPSEVQVLWLSPGFIEKMAGFLATPAGFQANSSSAWQVNAPCNCARESRLLARYGHRPHPSLELRQPCAERTTIPRGP